MRLDLKKLERQGISVDIYEAESVIDIHVERGASIFEPFLKLLEDTDLSSRNAHQLAEEFASKTEQRYSFQAIDNTN